MESLAHLVSAFGRALEGSRVAWFGDTHADAVREFRRLLDIVPRECKVHFTNGSEKILCPNRGTLEFLSVRSLSMRGMSAHRVYVPLETPIKYLDNIVPMVVVHPDGEIVYY